MVKKIQNYYLQQVVGEGQYGKVYKAINEKTQELVAIKVIKIQKFKMSPKLQQCTINEIQTLSKIEHSQHVVKFIEILKTVNNYYFVYQYCSGGTLQFMIKHQGHFSQTKALTYLMDLLKAFKVLTKHNIMHRDIKPSNILLHNGTIKIADFGFCKPLNSSKDLAQTMLGSPIYMAPQILRGQVYNIKADIWSLGVVFYEMLFGYCPFEEKSIAKLVTLLQQGTVIFPKNINNLSAKSEELLRKMLVKDHTKRINWQELFQYQLNSQGQLINKKDHSRISIQRKILQIKDQNQSVYSNYNFTKKPPVYQLEFKKTISTNQQGNILNITTQTTRQSNLLTTKPLIKLILQNRSKLQQGTKLVSDILQKCRTRSSISISCLIMKKVKEVNDTIQQQLKRLDNEKENEKINSQLRKTSSIIREQINQIKQRSLLFDDEAKKIFDQDKRIIQKYVEEANLLYEKEGTIHILQILDYIKGENNQSETKQYNKFLKQYLNQQYSKRLKCM